MRTIRCFRELSGGKLYRDEAEWRDLLFFPNSDSFVSNIFSATVHSPSGTSFRHIALPGSGSRLNKTARSE